VDGSLEEDDIDLVYSRRKDSHSVQRQWRKEAREAFEFRDGSQWDQGDRAILEEQRRPVVVFNRVAPIIDSIVGHEMGNRYEIRYLPRGQSDQAVNDVLNETARWVRDRCDAEDEESDAYHDCVTCGMGWMEMRVDYDLDPDGRIVVERVPPLEMRWDPSARKHNVVDAGWLMREKWLPLEEVKERWPDKAMDLTPTLDEYADEWPDEHDASRAWEYRDNNMGRWYDRDAKTVLLIHYQWREREPYYRVADPDSGEVVEIDEDRFEKMRETLEEAGIRAVRQTRWKYRQMFVAGRTVMEESDAPIDGFSYYAITAKRDEQEGFWYGMVRAMRDPQKWANAFFSQAMFSLMAGSKGGVIAEEGAVSDKRDFEEKWASADGVIYVEDGALQGGRIQEKSFGGYPPALDKLMAFAISSIRDCTGVNLELLGMSDRDQPGVLEVERKKAALTILAPMLNNLRRFRKDSGRALLMFMSEYLAPGTVVKITESEMAITWWGEDDVSRYDVVVDTAASSPNIKNEVWGVMQNMVPALIKAGVPLPPSLIKFSPLPESVSSEWVKYIEERSGVPADAMQQVQQLQQEMQKLQEENKKLRDTREQHQMTIMQRLETAQLEAQIAREKAAMEANLREQEMIWKAKTSDADRAAKLMEVQARFEADMAKLKEQSELERQVTSAKLASEHQINSTKIEADRERARLEREERFSDDFGKHVDTVDGKIGQRVENAMKSIKDDVAALQKLQEEAERRREMILSFLESRGGDVATLAKKLH